jgi:hypothetical protein
VRCKQSGTPVDLARRNQIFSLKLVFPPQMTRPKDKLAHEKEAKLQLAIAAVLNNEHTCHSAAIAFEVPR